jgi:adenylate kinase family enzyme
MNSNATLEPAGTTGHKAAPSAVLGFAAPIEAGKTTISTAVAEQLNAPRVSFGGYLRKLAKSKGLEITREVLQDLGDELVRRDVHAFCREVLGQQPSRPGVPLVIDGVRHLEVLSALGTILAPAAAYLIFIKVDRQTQANRLLHDELRHEKSLEDLEKHPTERQVRSVLPDKASLVLDGTRPPDELIHKVIDFLTNKTKEADAERGWEKKNARRLELAEKKSVGELAGAEIAEFDQLQTEYFEYLDAKFPRTPADLQGLAEIEARLKAAKPSPQGE